jgi:hypothetical protein
MGRLGMELGSTPRLLQSRLLGRLGKSLSTAAHLVPSATHSMGQPTRIRRKLGLSPAELSSAQSSIAPAAPKSPWNSTGNAPARATVQARQARRSGHANNSEADQTNEA